ncbi:MAG: DUF4416 family protein [Desulfarculus sp.]|nr:DUF4416 family protein [Desulfarculus sp.]
MNQPAPPARLLVSLLAASEAPRTQAVRRLAQDFGPLDYLSRPLAFDQTGYYAPEMGQPLTRRLASFRRLVPAHGLAQIKLVCQALEAGLAQEGRRRVNIDPGLLCADSLVLASGKRQGHRLALAEGLWAELTLWFHHGDYHPLPWTYPDYAGASMRRLLGGLRARYLWQLREDRPQGGTP